MGLDDGPVVVDVGKQPKRDTGQPAPLARVLRLKPAPFVSCGPIPKGRRVTRIRHHKQASAAVPPDRYHRGVVHVVELLLNRLIEITHKSNLFQRAKVSLHEFLKLLAQRDHGQSMAAHIGERDTRDDATGAQRNVMDIAASLTGPGRCGMHPSNQAGQLHQTGGSLVTGPRFRTLKAS